MYNPLVSIIIPVYNGANYMREAIDSAIAQTYCNIEILVINDGSTDNGKTEEIALSYGDKIRYFYKENGGVSSARNAGIEKSVGDYVMFVDGDDWLNKDTVLECVKIICETNAECVLFSYVKEYKNNSIPINILQSDFFAKSEEECLKIYHRFFGLVKEELKHPELADSFVPLWSKVYKKELVQKAKFFDTNTVGSCEDGLFNIYALQGCSKLYYINHAFYHYRKTNEGSLTSDYREQLPKLWLNLFALMKNAIDELELPLICESALNNRIALSVIGIGFSEICNPDKKQAKKRIKEWLSSEIYVNAIGKLDFKYLTFKWKVFLWFCKKKKSCMVYSFLKVMNRLRRKRKC